MCGRPHLSRTTSTGPERFCRLMVESIGRPGTSPRGLFSPASGELPPAPEELPASGVGAGDPAFSEQPARVERRAAHRAELKIEATRMARRLARLRRRVRRKFARFTRVCLGAPHVA